MKKAVWVVMSVLVSSLWFISCKKAKNVAVNSDQLIMATPIGSGDSVKLSWSKVNNDSLIGYTLTIVYDTTNPSAQTRYGLDKNTTEYTDIQHLTAYVQYYVTASFYSGGIVSNKVIYSRPDITFIPIRPIDVLFDKSTDIMYLYGYSDSATAQSIIMYNVATQKIVAQTVPNTVIGYCDIGTYNGQKELYVPRSDGWIFIYNAATLQQIDQINTGAALTSVVYNNGLLFTTGSFTDSSYMQSAEILSYNRATKAMVSRNVNFSVPPRLRLVPNTNSYLFGTDANGVAYYIHYDSSGHLVSLSNSSSIYGTASFEVFPDGSKMITGGGGAIINDSLQLLTSLLAAGTYSSPLVSFDFDTANQLIYTCYGQNTVQAYSMSSYQLTKTINSKGIPFSVFYNNGAVLLVGESYAVVYDKIPTNFYFVEQL